MNAKDKAKELVEKFAPIMPNEDWKEKAKQCALIAVEEIDKAIDFDWMEVQNLESQHRYWANVRIEIEKL